MALELCAIHTFWQHTQRYRDCLSRRVTIDGTWLDTARSSAETLGKLLAPACKGLWEQLLFCKAWLLAYKNRRIHFIQLGKMNPPCSKRPCMSTLHPGFFSAKVLLKDGLFSLQPDSGFLLFHGQLLIKRRPTTSPTRFLSACYDFTTSREEVSQS